MVRGSAGIGRQARFEGRVRERMGSSPICRTNKKPPNRVVFYCYLEEGLEAATDFKTS